MFDAAWYGSMYLRGVRAAGNPLSHYLKNGHREGKQPSPFFDTKYYASLYNDTDFSEINPLDHYFSLPSAERQAPHWLFDRKYYLSANTTRIGDQDAYVHFITEGDATAQSPHPLFNSLYYLGANKDVAVGRQPPFRHFVYHGLLERRDVHPLFDKIWYLARCPEATKWIHPLIHYLLSGDATKYSPSPLFDPDWYLAQTNEESARRNPLIHYLEYGCLAGLSPHPLFDAQWYRKTQQPKDEWAIEPLSHFLLHGLARGLDPHPLFAALWYLQHNPDVATAGDNPLVHYMTKGAAEHRAPHPRFDTRRYLDICARRGEFPENALVHFLLHGSAEDADIVAPTMPASDAGRSMSDFFDHIIENVTTAARKGLPQLHEAGSASASERRSEPSPSEGEHGPAVSRIVAQLIHDEWYRAKYSDIRDAEMDSFDHYLSTGWKEGRWPNPYFDTNFYVSQGKLTLNGSTTPLHHYVTAGENQGLRPSLYFDPEWYRRTYALDAEQCALLHYLNNIQTGKFSPIEEFDTKFYLGKNPDVRDAGIDPFFHYIESGFREARDPSAEFKGAFYTRRYLNGDNSVNPLLHYLVHKDEPGISYKMLDDAIFFREVKRFSAPGDGFEEFEPLPAGRMPRAKVLAFYLPQFHQMEENDKWWGKGFTEWTNIPKGVPRYVGHYQPRIPRDLGFYDLTSRDAIRRQVELAQKAGLFGFVFYYYWFNGRRLLDKPLDLFAQDRSLDFPFCVMWANENWTRRWDGLESEILIEQNYAEEDDERLIQSFNAYFSDPRYIRIDGRPLLMIYRPGLIPDAAAVFARWRKAFSEVAGAQPILIMAQGFGDTDPRVYDLDGAIEFPPHKVAQGLSPINAELRILDPDFEGNVFSYDAVVERSVGEPPPPFPLIKTAFPSWDNEARRLGRGTSYIGSSPAAFQAWMEELIAFSHRSPFMGERLVCVNAWNEWAEGAYLEPDLHFGAAYLNALSRSLTQVSASALGRIVIVSHDAYPHGAQLIILNIARSCKRRFGMEVASVLLEDGPLLEEFRALGSAVVARSEAEQEGVFAHLFATGYRVALVNSAASARAVVPAARVGLAATLLVHELPSVITDRNLQGDLAAALPLVGHVVFPAEFVRSKFAALMEEDASKARLVVQPQGCYTLITYREEDRQEVRRELGISDDAVVVLGVGFADLRKGFDLFLACWRILQRRREKIHFIWLGDIEKNMALFLGAEIKSAEGTGTFHAVPFRKDVGRYYSASDLFLLTSREDPFPSVVLEALQTGIPSVAFSGTGGMADLIEQHQAGRVVPLADTAAAAAAIIDLAKLMKSPGASETRTRLRGVAAQYDYANYVGALISLCQPNYIRISAVVPNYNYAHYLAQRMNSIFDQTYPLFEVIVLDNCSTDNSIEELERLRDLTGRQFTVIRYDVNSGNVFRQWRRAVDLAQGDFIWIAEADDSAEPRLIEKLANAIVNEPKVVMAYADSRAIDQDGFEVSPSYKSYCDEASPGVFHADARFDTQEFVREHLSERNLILNVSAALWKRDVLRASLEQVGDSIFEYRLVGDWFLYVAALSSTPGYVGYVAEPLNVHRRHRSSNTSTLKPDLHLAEIVKVQDFVRTVTDIPAQNVEKQIGYRQKIRSQFGLPATDEEPGTMAPAPPGRSSGRARKPPRLSPMASKAKARRLRTSSQ